MKPPDSPIERLIKQMSLKKPSTSLDERINSLSVNRETSHGKRSSQSTNRRAWRRTIVTSALSLAIGLAAGSILTYALQDRPVPETQSEAWKQDFDHSELLAENSRSSADTSSPSINATPADAKTQILGDRLVTTADGELKRIYRTATPRDFWYFDEDAKRFRNITIAVPRFIVTTPNGI